MKRIKRLLEDIVSWIVNLLKGKEMKKKIDQLVSGDNINIPGYGTIYVKAVWDVVAGQYRWTEYDLIDRIGGKKLALDVEFDDGEWVATLFDRELTASTVTVDLMTIPFQASALPKRIEVGDLSYRIDEKGTATYSLRGSNEKYQAIYADYKAEGNVLSIVVCAPPGGLDDRYPEIWEGRDLDASTITY